MAPLLMYYVDGGCFTKTDKICLPSQINVFSVQERLIHQAIKKITRVQEMSGDEITQGQDARDCSGALPIAYGSNHGDEWDVLK